MCNSYVTTIYRIDNIRKIHCESYHKGDSFTYIYNVYIYIQCININIRINQLKLLMEGSNKISDSNKVVEN